MAVGTSDRNNCSGNLAALRERSAMCGGGDDLETLLL